MIKIEDIKISTPKLKVLKICKKTTAVGFKDLKVGDTFYLEVPIYDKKHRYGQYAKYFNMSINDGPMFETPHSYNTLYKYYWNFELDEVKEKERDEKK